MPAGAHMLQRTQCPSCRNAIPRCVCLHHACQALEYVAKKYAGHGLQPGGVIADHSDGFRNAYEKVWPSSQFGQCWPHISRKFSRGEYCSKTWAGFEEVKGHLFHIHMVCIVHWIYVYY